MLSMCWRGMRISRWQSGDKGRGGWGEGGGGGGVVVVHASITKGTHFGCDAPQMFAALAAIRLASVSSSCRQSRQMRHISELICLNKFPGGMKFTPKSRQQDYSITSVTRSIDALQAELHESANHLKNIQHPPPAEHTGDFLQMMKSWDYRTEKGVSHQPDRPCEQPHAQRGCHDLLSQIALCCTGDAEAANMCSRLSSTLL